MKQVTGKTESKRLESLQLLRGVAAGLVVYVHAYDTFRDKVDGSVFLNSVIGFGELGVKIFFCISGFIIFESIRNLPKGTASFYNFVKKRLIRIVPLYWLATLVYASKQTLTGTVISKEDLLLSLAFIPYPDEHGLMRPIIGAGWTLNFEMVFYGITAATILVSKSARAPVLIITIGILAAMDGLIPLDTNFLLNALSLISSSYLIFFLAGIFCSAASHHPIIKNAHSSSIKSLVAPPVLVGLFIFCINTIGLSENLHFASTLLFSVACVLASTTYRSDRTDGRNGFFKRKLEKISVVVGDGSYSTYLTHGFVMGPCARLIHVSGLDISPLFFAILMVILCSSVGALLYIHVESPIQKTLHRRLIGKSTLNPAV